MKGEKKKIVKGILNGFILGLLLCVVAYIVLAFVYKRPTSTPTSGITTEVAEREFEKIDQSKYKVTENKKFAEEFAAAEVLIPSKCEELFTISTPAIDVDLVQGGCTDGKYVYQLFYGADLTDEQFNNKCVVVKCDLKTGKVVATSEAMQLNHANDVTYNSKLGYLVVCHNAPLSNMISYIDAETLELVDTFATENYMFSLDYNATRDQYVVGLIATKTFQILDADFKPVTDVFQPTKAYRSSVNQGGACDDNYIYFIYYKTNVINVYDWDGNFLTSIELESKIQSSDYEVESLTSMNGEMYIFCGQGKATVFKVSDFIPKPEEIAE